MVECLGLLLLARLKVPYCLTSCMDTHCQSSASALQERSQVGKRQILLHLPSLCNFCQEGRTALVCVLNRNKEAVLLYCFPPCPSCVVFLANVASLPDLSVPQALKDSCFWNLSSIFIKL